MKFSAAAVLAAAAGVHAWSNVTYTTEVVTALTTYCPVATEITHGGSTYTVTSATTLTITNCPCTITKPVTTVSSVICNSCSSYSNSTTPVVTASTAAVTTPGSVGTTSVGTIGTSPTTTKAVVPTAGAGKLAMSGAGLAGVVVLAAFL